MMKVLNISRLGNQINDLQVIGMNTEGLIILSGMGEKLNLDQTFNITNRLAFYLYNPVTDELKADIFRNFKVVDILFHEFHCKHYLGEGVGYYIEAADEQKANIVRCDFNHNTYECLFSICISDIFIHNIHLFALTDRYFSIKLFNKESCQINIYDLQQHKKYDLLFPENDDMRYADIHYINVNGKPHILFIKNSKSDWKMEYLIHKWEWTEEFIKYKDEKIFLFPLQELISKGNIYLDETYKIAQVGETHDLHYHSYFNNCIIYSCQDLRHYDEDGLYENAVYVDNIFFYDIEKKITSSMPYDGHLLISNKGDIYGYENINAQLVIRNLIDNQVYTVPDQNGWFPKIIDDLLIMRFKRGIVIYDFKKGIEIEKYYNENQYLNVRPEIRAIAALQQDYKYLASENLLVLY